MRTSKKFGQAILIIIVAVIILFDKYPIAAIIVSAIVLLVLTSNQTKKPKVIKARPKRAKNNVTNKRNQINRVD